MKLMTYFFLSHVFLPLTVAELSTSYRSSRTYLSWMQTVLAQVELCGPVPHSVIPPVTVAEQRSHGQMVECWLLEAHHHQKCLQCQL